MSGTQAKDAYACPLHHRMPLQPELTVYLPAPGPFHFLMLIKVWMGAPDAPTSLDLLYIPHNLDSYQPIVISMRPHYSVHCFPARRVLQLDQNKKIRCESRGNLVLSPLSVGLTHSLNTLADDADEMK